MDRSVYEKRQLAVLERQLSDDRRLVALLAEFDSHRSASRRRLRCALLRLRYRRPGPGSRPARLAVFVAACLTIAGPMTLIVALLTGVQALSIVALGLLPLAPVLLVLAQHWVRRTGTPAGRRRSRRGADR